MKIIFLLLLVLAGNPAGEKMWLFDFAREINRAEMEALGGRIAPSEIYSVNHYSIKDAIVKLSDGTAGAVISKDGMVIARPRQAVDSVTFMVEMQDVSSIIERAARRGEGSVRQAFQDLASDAEARQWHCKAAVQKIGDGIYYLVSYRTYTDVRLVSQTSNGFSISQIYENNIPVTPGKTVEISSAGIQKDAFHIVISYSEQMLMQMISLGTAVGNDAGVVLDADGKLVGLASDGDVIFLNSKDILK